jgi:hypothetical protein
MMDLNPSIDKLRESIAGYGEGIWSVWGGGLCRPLMIAVFYREESFPIPNSKAIGRSVGAAMSRRDAGSAKVDQGVVMVGGKNGSTLDTESGGELGHIESDTASSIVA